MQLSASKLQFNSQVKAKYCQINQFLPKSSDIATHSYGDFIYIWCEPFDMA